MERKRPNILFLMSDQHRYDFTGYMGHVAKTPTLDMLAETGVRFDNAYCASPVCVPGRQCMMAGQLPRTCGAEKFGDDLPPFSMTFAKRMAQYGYASACAGKLHHMGADQMQGWTHRMGWWDMEVEPHYVEGKKDDEYAKYPKPKMWDLAKEIKMSGAGYHSYVRHDEYSVAGALQFIEEHFCDSSYDKHHKDRPLMMKVSLQQPHYAYIAEFEKFSYYLNRVQPFAKQDALDHPKFKGDWTRILPGEDVSEREIRKAHAAYAAMIEEIDGLFKRVIDGITHVGENIDDWIIVYTSDHGDMMGEYNLWWKLKFYEGSVRVPLLIRAPNYIEGARRVRENVNHCDLFATLCDLAGIPVPEGRDSRSMVGLMKGDAKGWRNESVSQVNTYGLMIKHDDLKYIYYGEDVPEVLFDLATDPKETMNMIDNAAYADAVTRFRTRRGELGHGPNADPHYVNAGYAPNTHLPTW